MHNPHEGETPKLVMSITGVDGAATFQDGHALRFLPASPKSRTMQVWLHGVHSGMQLSRCEVSLLE